MTSVIIWWLVQKGTWKHLIINTMIKSFWNDVTNLDWILNLRSNIYYDFLFLWGLCLLAVMVMYLVWIQVLDTLEQFALHQRVSSCPSFHLTIQHGPSFLLAPVAVFFCLLSGLLFILIGQSIYYTQLEKRNKIPELAAPEAYLEDPAHSCLAHTYNESHTWKVSVPTVFTFFLVCF